MRKKNPDMNIQNVNTAEFLRYGRILQADPQQIITYVKQHISIPEVGSIYESDIAELHTYDLFHDIKRNVFGELPIEIGLCHGHNTALTGLEYHIGSEVNIAVTDCLLALGRKEALNNNTIKGSSLEVFFIPQGTVLELYEGTLHYCPFSALKSGFSMLVILLDKTNSRITFKKGTLLTKRNKWFIAHIDNHAKINAGNVAGLLGEKLQINL